MIARPRTWSSPMRWMRRTALIATAFALFVGTALSDIKTVGFGKARKADGQVAASITGMATVTPHVVLNPPGSNRPHDIVEWHQVPEGSLLRLNFDPANPGTHAIIAVGVAGGPPHSLVGVYRVGGDARESLLFHLDPHQTRALDGHLSVTVVYVRFEDAASAPFTTQSWKAPF